MKHRPYRRSRINDWKDCHYNYLMAVRGVEGGNIHTDRGIRLHEVLEHLVAGENVSSLVTEDEVSRLQMVVPFYRGKDIERAFYVDIDGNDCAPENAFIYCRADAFGHREAEDLKCGQWGYYDAYSDKMKYQADYYMCCFRPHLPKTGLYLFKFHFPFLESPDLCTMTFEYDLEKLDEVWDRIAGEILTIEKEIEKGVFEPNYDSCGRCLRYASCDKIKGIEMDNEIIKWEGGITKENFGDALEILNRIKAMEKHASKAIEQYVKDNGTQVVGDREYGYKSSERRNVADVKGLVLAMYRECPEAREEIYGNLNMTVSSADMLAKKYRFDTSPYMGKKGIQSLGWL